MRYSPWFALLGLLGTRDIARAPDDLCITNVTVISAERTEPRLAMVCIDKGRIVAVDTTLTGRTPTGRTATDTINGTGRFLTPGLIDSHVHVYHAPGLNRRYTAQYDTLLAAYLAQLPRSFLYYGYTSVIELNAVASANRRFEAAAAHPDLYHCGQGLVLSNDFMATDYDSPTEFLQRFPNFLHDRFTTPTLPPGYDPREHTPAATVARIAEQGGRCVKLYYEEALWWPGPERPAFKLPSPEIVREVAREAHRRGMQVVLHATTPAGYRLALETGVDIVAHGLWEWPGSFRNGSNIPQDVTTLGDSIASSGICVQPTAQTLRGTFTLFEPTFLENAALRNVLPATYLDYLRTDAQVQRKHFVQQFGSQIGDVALGEEALIAEATRALGFVNTRFEGEIGRWQRQGACLLLGTDTAVGGFGWSQPPGLAGFLEMQAWARGGVPLTAIFRAATLGNAQAFGLAYEIGTVEVGKRANLLLLQKDPTRDLAAYDAIDTVILGGRLINRKSLSAR